MGRRLNKLLSALFAAMILASPGQNPRAQARPSSPEEVVRQFYRWYLTAGYPAPDRQRAKFRRHVTQRCLKEATAAEDYVYFIQAQDADPGWKNHIAVASATIKGRTAKTSLILVGRDFSNKLEIELIQENGAWKIDKVKGESP